MGVYNDFRYWYVFWFDNEISGKVYDVLVFQTCAL